MGHLIRRTWLALTSLVTLLAIYTTEPLVVMGPAAMSLIMLPGFFFVLIVLFGTAAVGRLAFHRLQQFRRPVADGAADR